MFWDTFCQISEVLKTRKYAVFLFLDIRKPFESVSHEILLGKLSKIGFKGNINSFLRSYIENRYQSVIISGNTSSLLEIIYGVAQGSVLGPLL